MRKQGALIVQDSAKMNLDTRDWVASATPWRKKSRNALGLKPHRSVGSHSTRRIASAFDRVLATRYGLAAIDMVHRGDFDAWPLYAE